MWRYSSLLPVNSGFAPSKRQVYSEQKYTKGTVPFVYFLLKKVEEMFGGFRYFLYLCTVNHERQKAGGGGPM